MQTMQAATDTPTATPGVEEELDLRAEDDALIAAELEAALAKREERRPRPTRTTRAMPPDVAVAVDVVAAEAVAVRHSKQPSTTAKRVTGCGSIPRSSTTPSTPNTGPGIARSQ